MPSGKSSTDIIRLKFSSIKIEADEFVYSFESMDTVKCFSFTDSAISGLKSSSNRRPSPCLSNTPVAPFGPRKLRKQPKAANPAAKAYRFQWLIYILHPLRPPALTPPAFSAWAASGLKTDKNRSLAYRCKFFCFYPPFSQCTAPYPHRR